MLSIGFWRTSNKSATKKFEDDIRKYTLVNEEMKNIIDGFPASAHPMGVLSALTSALTAFNPKPVDVKSENDVCITLFVKLLVNLWFLFLGI
jgi:citrate synthase